MTFFNGNTIKSYIPDPSHPTPILYSSIPTSTILSSIPPSPLNVLPIHRTRTNINLGHIPPYRDHHHFKEFFKPWVNQKKTRTDPGPHQLWFKTLRQANSDWVLNIDVDKVEKFGMRTAVLGLFPTNRMVMDVQTALMEEDAKRNNDTSGNQEVNE